MAGTGRQGTSVSIMNDDGTNRDPVSSIIGATTEPVGLTGNYTLKPSDCGKLFFISGTRTVTLSGTGIGAGGSLSPGLFCTFILAASAIITFSAGSTVQPYVKGSTGTTNSFLGPCVVKLYHDLSGTWYVDCPHQSVI